MTSVLEYIEDTPRVSLKQIVTVKRTQNSKFLLYVLVRHYRIETRKKPTFISYSKSEVNSVKGLLEEITLFGGQDLYVLEGFPLSFVTDLNLPKDVFVVAEVDDGELEAPIYSYKQRRGAIKVTLQHLGLKLPLRDLLSLDWGSARDYADIEVVLRKALAAGWGVDGVGKLLQGSQLGNILLLLKKGNLVELLNIKSKYSDGWLTRHVTKLVPQLATYRSLVAMGQSPSAIAESLGVSSYRMREFEEAAKAVNMADLKTLAERVIQLDRLSVRHSSLATDLLILKSGIALKR